MIDISRKPEYLFALYFGLLGIFQNLRCAFPSVWCQQLRYSRIPANMLPEVLLFKIFYCAKCLQVQPEGMNKMALNQQVYVQ